MTEEGGTGNAATGISYGVMGAVMLSMNTDLGWLDLSKLWITLKIYIEDGDFRMEGTTTYGVRPWIFIGSTYGLDITLQILTSQTVLTILLIDLLLRFL